MKNKFLASLDIKSLRTNIPAIKFTKPLEIHLKKTNITLPLYVNKIIKIHIYICIAFFFHYIEKFSLCTGSSFCRALICLFPEFLKTGPFKFIIPEYSNYFSYKDDVLLIYPQNDDLTKTMDRLNKTESTIEFTYNIYIYIYIWK